MQPSRLIKKSCTPLAACDKLADVDSEREVQNDSRALWLVILQALAMVASAIRKHVGAKGCCDRCGRVY